MTAPTVYVIDVPSDQTVYEPRQDPAPPASFAPSSLTGLVNWLRADLGITKDGSNNVSAWADQSGAGICTTYSQGTAGNQPLWVANGINGKPHVTTATSKLLVGNTSVLAATDNTMFAIVRTSSVVADQGIYGMRYNAHHYSLDLSYNAAGKVQYVDFDATNATSDNVINDGLPHVVVLTRVKGGNATIYVDGTTASATTGACTSTITNVTADSNAVGGIAHDSVTFGQGFNGDIAEVGMYSRALNGTEIGQLVAYLKSRAGI